MIDALLFRLLDLAQDFRRVRFRTHKAHFKDGGAEHLFLTVTNVSRAREIEVTHVWLATSPIVSALPVERPLPVRLRPDQVWETWIPIAAVRSEYASSLLRLGRVRLSDGRTLKSRPDADVPPEGYVPGNAPPRPGS
jgi:hypothetical protein